MCSFPPELVSVFALVNGHANFLFVDFVIARLVPAEVVDVALVVLVALFVLDAVGAAHRLVVPVGQHVAVGAGVAVCVLMAADVDGLASALAVIADRTLALVVVFAVTSWVLILSGRY